MKLIIENVRCFAGKHTIPIKPLTILTGENSSGKTTFLAALSAVNAASGYPIRPGFNDPPYNLGNFDTIITKRDSSADSPLSFSLGQILDHESNKDVIETMATYEGIAGQIELLEFRVRNSNGAALIDFEGSGKHPIARVTLENRSEYYFEFRLNKAINRLVAPDILVSLANHMLTQIMKDQRSSEKSDDLKLLNEAFHIISSAITASIKSSPQSIAPIRSKPKRTYDQLSEEYEPEGSHIPFVMARILSGESRDQRTLSRALRRFGRESGLFQDINPKRLGKGNGDPFQLQVQVNGLTPNLIDVGYGISQALPVVVQSVLSAKERLLLLQQPEVHLHPKAQAALGTFFVDLAAKAGKQFVIETHSDYIVDRIRQEVAQNKISYEDVMVLFFEKKKSGTYIHQIRLDEFGNILDAPPCYRAFFLHEELNLLTRTKG